MIDTFVHAAQQGAFRSPEADPLVSAAGSFEKVLDATAQLGNPRLTVLASSVGGLVHRELWTNEPPVLSFTAEELATDASVVTTEPRTHDGREVLGSVVFDENFAAYVEDQPLAAMLDAMSVAERIRIAMSGFRWENSELEKEGPTGVIDNRAKVIRAETCLAILNALGTTNEGAIPEDLFPDPGYYFFADYASADFLPSRYTPDTQGTTAFPDILGPQLARLAKLDADILRHGMDHPDPATMTQLVNRAISSGGISAEQLGQALRSINSPVRLLGVPAGRFRGFDRPEDPRSHGPTEFGVIAKHVEDTELPRANRILADIGSSGYLTQSKANAARLRRAGLFDITSPD